MEKIATWFIRRPKVVNLIIVFIILAGVISLFNIKKQGYPSVDYGWISVSTIYPGASPSDVEEKVTIKLEESLKGVDGIKKSSSYSMESYSGIFLQVDDNADISKVRDDVKEKVDKVTDLPDDAKKTVVSVLDVNSTPVIEVAITGDASYNEKRAYAEDLEKKLLKSKFVGKITKEGFLDKEITIEADNSKLNQNYISLNELMRSISTQNFRMSAGDLKGDKEKKYVVMSEFKKPLDVNNVIIKSSFEGEKIQVKDVANVKEGFKKPDHIVKYNGENAIILTIIKKPDADIINAVTDIHKVINNFKSKLPENIILNVIVDYSTDVKNLFQLVIDNAQLGFILVIIALIIMLNYKIAFWTAMGIPTSIFIAFALFPFLNITLNFISLIAIIIVLGMLVDDAIVIGENIFRYREAGFSPEEAAIKGLNEVLWPVITTVLTTIIVFLPMITMKGILGKFMREMPIVVSLMLAGSLIESIFLLPSHIAHIKIKKKSERKGKTFFNKIEDLYEKFILITLKRKYFTILFFILFFIGSLILLVTGMKFILFPSDDGNIAYIKYRTERGTPLNITAEKVKSIEEVLLNWPVSGEIAGFVTTNGQESPSIASEGANMDSPFMGNILIHLTPMRDRERIARDILKELKEKLNSLQGFEKLEADIVEDGPPVGRAVTVTILGNNDVVRNKLSAEIKNFLKEKPGVSRIEDNQGTGKKQIQIIFDYQLMARLGLNPLEAADVIRTAFDGSVVTTLRWNGENIDYRVILDDSSRKSTDTLGSINIENYNSLTVQNMYGKLIPLGQIIKTIEKDDLMLINHDENERSISVFADVDTEIITSTKINQELKSTFIPIVDQYPGMEITFGGEEQDTQEAMTSLYIALILALVGVYFILVILFNSFIQPFLVMITIPFSLSGVIVAFYLHNMPFSFVALIGMIGLCGVVVNDSLVMITFLNNKAKEGNTTIFDFAEAAKHRLRPIILTSSTTAAGLFPTAYGFGGDNALIVPMIMAIAWGLIFATLLTLVLLPSLYLVLLRIRQKITGLLKREPKLRLLQKS